MGLAFALMWSSAFTSARIIVADAPPLLALALRFAISGALAVGVAAALGQTWRMGREQWRATVVFGLCQNALYLGLNFIAMQTVEAGLAAIIASSLPLWVTLVGWLGLGERQRPLGLIGLVAGFIGVLMVMGTRLSDGVDAVGVALCIVGVLALTVATLSVKGATAGGNLLMIVGLQMWVGAGALALAGFAFETPEFEPSWRLAAAFTYTVIVPGLAATWVWFMLVNRVGMVRASTFHFLNPFFGVAIAAVLLGEVLRPLDLVGVAVIMAGILAVQRSKLAGG